MAQMSSMPVPDFSASAVPDRHLGWPARPRLDIGEYRRQATENHHQSAPVESGCADDQA